MNYIQFLNMVPEAILVAILIITFIADFIAHGKENKSWMNPLVCLMLLGAAIATVFVGEQSQSLFGGAYIATPANTMMKAILCAGTFIVVLQSRKWLSSDDAKLIEGEFYMLTISTLLGMYIMMSAGSFLMFFLGLETASVPLACMVALDKYKKDSAEAAAKFILTATFSSGVMLYGLSFLYGATGTLYFGDFSEALEVNAMTICGMVFFVSGLGFKLSLVPFHFWTADTYQGAPTPITAYLSVISKGAAVFACMSILFKAFPTNSELWQNVLWIIIVLTIVVGNLFAMRQENIKRFFAYSSVSQAGYIMLGVVAGNEIGISTTVFYILVYMFTNLAAFGVISIIERKSGKLNISDYNGLYGTNPKLAVIMMLALFSLGGIPPFAGMFSKFFIFVGLFKSGMLGLLFIALINTVVSLYYYLLIVKAMFINDSEKPIAKIESDKTTLCAVVICTIAVLLIGFISPIYHYIESVSSTLN